MYRCFNCSEHLLWAIYFKCVDLELAAASIVSHLSDHACIHKCTSDMRCVNSPMSLLSSQFLGMRSLIRYGFGTGFADTLYSAVTIPLNTANLPLTASCSSFANLLCHICHFFSQLLLNISHVCCDHACVAVFGGAFPTPTAVRKFQEQEVGVSARFAPQEGFCFCGLRSTSESPTLRLSRK